MIRRPPFGDIVATATVAALTGTFILVVGIAIVSAASANDLQQLEIISIGFGLGAALALFFVWSVGILVEAVVGAIADGGYWQAALAGALTGSFIAWIFASPVEADASAIWGISAWVYVCWRRSAPQAVSSGGDL
jgi:hypothetical protein